MSAFSEVVRELQAAGFARLSAAEASLALGLDLDALASLRDTWEHLPRDAYLRDGGAYRARRHSCFVQAVGATPMAVPHRPHWQPTAYNALHGGLTRWFEPIEPAVRTNPAWLKLLASLGALFAAVHPVPRWFIEAHQFRIDTGSGIGRPTPEGAHRDGVDFVAVILVGRRQVIGGETRVFDSRRRHGGALHPVAALVHAAHGRCPCHPRDHPAAAARGGWCARYARAHVPGGGISGARCVRSNTRLTGRQPGMRGQARAGERIGS